MIINFEIALSFSSRDPNEKQIEMFSWEQDPRIPKLSDLRAQLNFDLAKVGANWRFENAAGNQLNESAESNYALTRFYNDDLKKQYDRLVGSDDTSSEVNAPTINIVIYAPNGEQPPAVSDMAASSNNTKINLMLGEASNEVRFTGKRPDTVSLKDIRSQLKETRSNSLPDSFKFLNADGKAISNEGEADCRLTSLDPEPTVESDWGVYTVNVWAKDKVPGTQWDGTIPTPPDLVELPTAATAKPIDWSVVELDPFPPFDSDKEFTNWAGLTQEEKLKVAEELALAYHGFNLPEIKMGSIEAQGESREASTPEFLIGKKVLVPNSAKDVEGLIKFTQQYNTDAGYSRREVDIKRSLQVTTSVGVNYQNTIGAEAEFSYARNYSRNSVEQKWFFYCDILIEKAQIRLPFKDAAPDSEKIKVLPAFIDAFDKVSDTAGLFSFMREFGSLIARNVTIGGLVQVTDEKASTQDFISEDERIAWKVKAQGTNGALTVNVSNQGRVDDHQMQQSNNQFARSNIETKGGISSYSMAKDMPGWVGSLSDVSHWAPIRREDIVPIYVLLDPVKQARFVNLLNLAGKRFWEGSHQLPQLRLIDFDWYLSFYEKSVYSELD